MTGVGNPLHIAAGPINATVYLPTPRLNVTVYAYRTGSYYTYVVNYSSPILITVGGHVLQGVGSFTEVGPLRSQYCLGQMCFPVKILQPRVEAKIEGLYYVYYFPVVVFKITDLGPGDWSGAVEFNSPTKLYESNGGATTYHTPYGDVVLPASSDAFEQLLAQLGAQYEALPFKLDLSAGESQTFAVVPLGNIYIKWGNNTLSLNLPPLPAISLSNVTCVAQALASPVPLSQYAPVSANLTAWVVGQTVCSAVMSVQTNGYTVIDPLIALRTPYLAVFYMPRISVVSSTSFPVTGLAFPEAVVGNATVLAAFGYSCSPINASALPPGAPA
ncbi:MAG: hypothetical protein ACP5I3_12155, partial [Thermoproteus sp.]